METNSYSNQTYETQAVVPNQKKTKKHIIYTACALLLTAALALGCGYVGAYLANGGTDKVVIQKVSNSSEEGSGTTRTAVDVAKEISPTVVSIITEQMEVSQFWFGTQVSSGAGSGVILSQDGYILTCAHVVDGADVIQVTTADGVEYEAEVVGSYTEGDIAVLKIDAEGLQAAVLGDSDLIQLGETVYAVGNPGGTLSGTLTDGIISATERTISISVESDSSRNNSGNRIFQGMGTTTQTISLDVIQTNAAVSPGSSGGGLFNADGELIGIVNAKSSGENQEGLGFAIPINKAQEIAEALINDGTYADPNAQQSGNRAVLGISVAEVSQAMASMTNMQAGIYVQAVQEGGASDGKLEVNDRLVSIDGNVAQTTQALSELLAEYEPGDIVTVAVVRDGKLISVEIQLAENANMQG